MKYTFRQLVNHMERMGNNLADVAVGRMMDVIFDETGNYPSWGDVAPDWVVKNCLGK